MAINFPDSPSVDDVFTSGNKTWKWNGSTWSSSSTPIGLGLIGDVALTSPATGDVVQYDGTEWVNADVVSSVTAAIVDSAPTTLDTLNELASALGDDPNFATTVTNSLAGKQDIVTGVSDTEIGYLDGVTSEIQGQLDAKVSSSNNANVQSGSYTLQASDIDKAVITNFASAGSITVPSGVFSNGTRVDIITNTASVITFVAGAGLSLRSKDSLVTLDGQYKGASIYYYTDAIAYLIGDLS